MKLQRNVTFVVYGKAETKGSARAFMRKGARFPTVLNDNPKAKGWQHLVSVAAQSVAHHGLFLGAVELRVVFYLPRPKSLPKHRVQHTKKPDVSKLGRCLEDGLTGVLFTDDAQIVRLDVSKVYAPIGEAPHAVVTLREVIAEFSETKAVSA